MSLGKVTDAMKLDSPSTFFDKFDYFHTYDPGMSPLSTSNSPE